MLKIARKRNTEAAHFCGDMRTVRLKKCFDAVAIPDSIGYMSTLKELRSAIRTAMHNLKPGGVLLIVGLVREDFQENSFVYKGSKGEVEVTTFKNNYAVKPRRATYEASIVYLIRPPGKALGAHRASYPGPVSAGSLDVPPGRRRARSQADEARTCL